PEHGLSERGSKSRRKLEPRSPFCNACVECRGAAMSDTPATPLFPLLERIADALERLAPKAPPEPDFAAARLFRHELEPPRFTPAPNYALPADLLVGVERQKARFAENLRRFALGLPANNALLWGV